MFTNNIWLVYLFTFLFFFQFSLFQLVRALIELNINL